MIYRPLAGLIFTTTLLIQSSSLYANNQIQSAPNPDEIIEAIQLDEDQLRFYSFIDELYKDEEYTRPSSCPIEPKGHEDLVNKIKSIELLLNNECLGTEVSTVEKILAGTQGIKDELDKATNADPSSGTTSIDGTEVSNYLNALNSINNLYIKMKCEGQRMSFLNKTAEFISGIAQLGLLSTNPNGIIIAAAGSAISAILNIIDDLFSKQYEFKYEDERMAFVKINCAFRDLRRDLQKSGLLNTGDIVHQRYAQKVNNLLGSLQTKMTELSSAKAEIEKPLQADKQNAIGQDLANIDLLLAKINELTEILSTEVSDNDIKKRQAMAKLYRFSLQFGEIENNNNSFTTLLNQYFFNNEQMLNNVLIFPENFLDNEIKQLAMMGAQSLRDRVNTISAKDFSARAKSLAGFLPFIIEDLNQLKTTINSEYQEQSRLTYDESVNEIIDSTNKKIVSKKSDFDGKVGRLTQIKNRLDNILMDEKIIATDNGSLNVVTIMEKYINVEKKFYGKLGKQFMDYIIDSGVDSLKDFERKMKKFYNAHTIDIEKAFTTDDHDQQVFDYNYIDSSKYSYEQKKRACQDLRPYLVRFTLSKALMNAGYDYIWTNRDLFHSDYARKLFRLFGLFSGEPQKYLQYHEKSATRANTLINGGSLSGEDFDKYIMGHGLSMNQSKKKNENEAICRVGSQKQNRFPAKGSKKNRQSNSTTNGTSDVRDNLSHHVKNLFNSDRRTQGMLMLLVNEYRPDAEFLSLIDTAFKCEKVLSDEGIDSSVFNEVSEILDPNGNQQIQIDRPYWQSSIKK